MKRVVQCGRQSIRAMKALLLSILAIAVYGQSVMAQSGEDITPHQYAENVKNSLVAVIKEKDKYEENGGVEAYYSAVQGVLDPVVDFRFIARAVMNKSYRSASTEQRAKFAEVFKKGLVATYANGMAGFVEHEIVIVPPKKSVEGKKRVSVGLEVRGGGSVNRVSFSLRKKDDIGWQLTNMILNGTNFGSLMQKQFAQAMKKSDNNIDAVIEGWTDA